MKRTYRVKYDGEVYDLGFDGSVEVSETSEVFDGPVVTADVIAGWGYINKLLSQQSQASEPSGAATSLGLLAAPERSTLYAMPIDDTILVCYHDGIYKFRVDVSTIKTTMRRRLTTFVDSIKQLREDLSRLIERYMIHIDASNAGMVILRLEGARSSYHATMKIDKKMGTYTTDVWDVLNEADVKPAGIIIDGVAFNYLGAFDTIWGERSYYSKKLMGEWQDILSLMREFGLKKTVYYNGMLPFSADRIRVHFGRESRHDFESYELVFNITMPGLSWRMKMMGDGHDAGRLSRFIKTCVAASSFPIHDDEKWVTNDNPWIVYLIDQAGGRVALIDSGDIVYDRDGRN